LTNRLPKCKIVASDISEEALRVAKLNAIRQGLFRVIDFVLGDLFEGVKGAFDIIVSNPPYISHAEFDELSEEVLREPRKALDGGEDGLEFYRKIFIEGAKYLNRGGLVIAEVGFGQSGAVQRIIDDGMYFRFLEVIKDFNGIPRVVIAQKRNLGLRKLKDR